MAQRHCSFFFTYLWQVMTCRFFASANAGVRVRPGRHSLQQYCDTKLPVRARVTIEWRMPLGRLSNRRTWHRINLDLLQRYN
jgi:hypothetical protein